MNLTHSLCSWLLAFLITPALTSGQSVDGVVQNENGQALGWAHVHHIDSRRHIHTDEIGRFTLAQVNTGDTLEITYLGYSTVISVIADTTTTITVKLRPAPIKLDEVVIRNTYDLESIMPEIDLSTNPVNSAQDILRVVPGLFIGQHAGGGKAEQIFLRGFDVDHGTDVGISVNSMPVNMVSHAHGQGYADLHFVIPETIGDVDYGKGPYAPDKGNFTTAGYIDLRLKERLDNSQISIEAGMFNTRRLASLINILNTDKHSAWFASEVLQGDGPFESPQNLNRINVMGRYSAQLPGKNKLSITASHFTSTWDASGQIPRRAVEGGLISRFGAIDDTEGGSTQRSSLILAHTKALDATTFIKNSYFYSKYDFELYSNFTFYVEDPLNGDQIRQREERELFGGTSEIDKLISIGNFNARLKAGLGLRLDVIRNNELSHTADRKTTLQRIQLGNITESNFYAFAGMDLELGDFTVSPGLRLDQFAFRYQDQLDSIYRKSSTTALRASPKLQIAYRIQPGLQVYLKGGAGFHSNDTRVITAGQKSDIIPGAFGSDLGITWIPSKPLLLSAAMWYLFMQQEFVYTGDAGIVEASGRTRRLGMDLSVRYLVRDWFTLDVDATYAHARTVDGEEHGRYIPLAPSFTLRSGLSIAHSGWRGGLHFRQLAKRPANEFNSIVANGYTVVDANINYTFRSITVGVNVENLFNTKWDETQFATESRLKDEAAPVEEIHFTPGVPFYLRGVMKFSF